MNIISKLTGGQIFSIVVLGFMLLVLLEWFRRETKEPVGRPWTKVAVRWIFVIIGGRITIHGFSELYFGRWMSIMWISLGTGIVYMASRERIEYLRQKRTENNQRSE